MKISRIELNNFKRFTHLVVEGIPETAKLVVLVGPNGSGKTSFLESMNQYYKQTGYGNCGDFNYILKPLEASEEESVNWWTNYSSQLVKISFYSDQYNQFGDIKVRGRFYFRSAYRNEPDFQINNMQRQVDPTATIRLQTLIQNDQTVSNNYQRLVANTIAGVFEESNNAKTVKNLREELTGRIRVAMNEVFEDLEFTSIGDPLKNGNFYFTKGTTKNFKYLNLSAGEKAAFDLILDLVVQSQYYPDAIYCIDEPELHMHTKLQGKVLRELYTLIPGSSQMWISTHSIGMLEEAEEIEKEKPGTVVFLDFGNRNFDEDQVIHPAKIGKATLDKFYELAFGDFAKLILPKTIVFCEGDHLGTDRKDFDKSIFETIFGETHPDTYFISGGACSDIENLEKTHSAILDAVFRNTEIIRIVDRDDLSNKEVEDLAKRRIKALKKRNLESYLLDDSVIKKLCESQGKTDKYNECLTNKINAINNSEAQGNPRDDLKKARGEIYTGLKRILGLNKCGNKADSFIRDTLAPLITPDMAVYKQLESEIFDGLGDS